MSNEPLKSATGKVGEGRDGYYFIISQGDEFYPIGQRSGHNSLLNGLVIETKTTIR